MHSSQFTLSTGIHWRESHHQSMDQHLVTQDTKHNRGMQTECLPGWFWVLDNKICASPRIHDTKHNRGMQTGLLAWVFRVPNNKIRASSRIPTGAGAGQQDREALLTSSQARPCTQESGFALRYVRVGHPLQLLIWRQLLLLLPLRACTAWVQFLHDPRHDLLERRQLFAQVGERGPGPKFDVLGPRGRFCQGPHLRSYHMRSYQVVQTLLVRHKRRR